MMLIKRSRVSRQSIEKSRYKGKHCVATFWWQIDEALEELHRLRREEQTQYQGCDDARELQSKSKFIIPQSTRTRLRSQQYGCTTRATSSLDEATKAAPAEKNGKLVLADNTLPTVAEIDRTDTSNNKHPCTKDPHTRR